MLRKLMPLACFSPGSRWEARVGLITRNATFTALCSLPHNAVFPKDLVRPCILAGCPRGGVVLDPFGGSGTVGQVAEELGRDAILVELNPVYVAMQQARTGVRNVIDPSIPTPPKEEEGKPGWLF